MANYKVTFVDIEVIKDGDPLDKGEIYWSFKVDGTTVSTRSVGNPVKVGSGGTITLGQSANVSKTSAAGVMLVVSGSVSEKDSGLSGKDESDSFTRNHSSGDAWGTTTPQVIRLTDRNLDVTLNYIVAAV